ncbi:MAG: hypothetical protein EOP61_20345 [Sphingomonadales bacterium]|nr:MAG: hypothetical protein EOP61_20345 [Sphingomonadales bacterium]
MTGHTSRNRLGIFALRAAPIQISYLGYPGTTGAPFFDYMIADRRLIPPEQRAYYSEKIIYLPHQYQAQDDHPPLPAHMPSRAELGLPDRGFVFCAINNSYKIGPAEFAIWTRLLKQVEGSVLWMLRSDAVFERNMLCRAAVEGVDPARIIFCDRSGLADYLAKLTLADLFLDSFTYNAGATASHALWAGLPVLTRTGAGYTARMAGSLLHAIGLPELITTSDQDYEALALALATDPERLARIKTKLGANRATEPLFDTNLFTHHIELGYQHAYQRYFIGLAPDDIDVADRRTAR